MLKYLLLCCFLDKKLYSTSSLSAKVPSVYAVVQFYPWFKDCFIPIITHYHIQKQRKFKIKIEPRIKLHHNIDIGTVDKMLG